MNATHTRTVAELGHCSASRGEVNEAHVRTLKAGDESEIHRSLVVLGRVGQERRYVQRTRRTPLDGGRCKLIVRSCFRCRGTIAKSSGVAGRVLRWVGGLRVLLGVVVIMEVLTLGAFNLRHVAASEIAERALVGSVILNAKTTFESVSGIVDSNDFGNGEVANVYKALTEMHQTNQPLNDVVLIATRLKAIGLLESMGGFAGLAKAAEYAMPHHAVYYANEVRRYSRIRQARAAAIAILSECERDDCSLAVVSSIAAKRLLRLSGAMELLEAMRESQA